MFNRFGGAAFPTFPGAEESGYAVYATSFAEETTTVHGNHLDKLETSWGQALMMAFETE